jgi:hypothetical protein
MSRVQILQDNDLSQMGSEGQQLTSISWTDPETYSEKKQLMVGYQKRIYLCRHILGSV